MRREMESLFAAPLPEDRVVIDLSDPRRRLVSTAAARRRSGATSPSPGPDRARRRRASAIDGAARTIDADGLALMPGIIDSHTHFDAQITWDPTLSPSPALGVTTAVIGNCGFTIAPCRPADRELTMRNLTQVEGHVDRRAARTASTGASRPSPNTWRNCAPRGSVANVAAYVGHSSVRTYVMGDDAAQREATRRRDRADAGDRARRDGARRGRLRQQHQPGAQRRRRPADAVAPGRATREMAALVGAMGEGGRGVYMLTKGGHTPIPFLESLAAATGRPVMVAALLHNSVNPRAVFDDLDAIAAANARGHRLLGQVSCCPLTMDFTLASPYPVEGLASWKPALGLSGAALEAVLADTRVSRRRARRAGDADDVSPLQQRVGQGPGRRDGAAGARAPRAAQRSPRSPPTTGRDPLDTMLDIALADDLKTVFTAQLLNSDEDAVGRMLNHPHSIVSLSDAGAHLTFFNDAGFGLHLLGHWSRDRGAMSLAEAVRRLTSHPASVFGLERPRPIARGLRRRPAAVRSEDGRPRTEAARPRPARRARRA